MDAQAKGQNISSVVAHGEGPGNGLRFLWLEVTNKCNLQCVHCYAESGPYEPQTHRLSHDHWLQILKDAYEQGCRQVQFIGGEPLLYPRLRELIDFVAARRFEFVEVFSNGTRADEDDIVFFKARGVRFATSFYAAEPSIHEKITKVSGSWTRTVNAIKKCVELEVPIRAGIIEMEENRDRVTAAAEFLRSLGVTNVGFDGLRGPRRGEIAVSGDPHEHLCGRCWDGTLTVNSAGKITPCVFSRSDIVGDVDDGLEKVLSSDKLRKFRKELFERERGKQIMMACRPDERCYPCNPQCNPNCSPRDCNPHCYPGTYCGPCSPNCNPCDPTPRGGCGPG